MLHATQAILFFPVFNTRNNLDETKVFAKHAVDFVPRNRFSNFGRQPNFVPFVQKLQIRCHPVQRIAEKLELFGTSSFFSHRNLHLLKELFGFKDVVDESFTLLDNDLSQFVFRVVVTSVTFFAAEEKLILVQIQFFFVLKNVSPHWNTPAFAVIRIRFWLSATFH